MLKSGWLWSCTVHTRARGFHWDYSHRRTDRYRERQGLPPDTHPWHRAITGALNHYHRYHQPKGCTCPTHTPLTAWP